MKNTLLMDATLVPPSIKKTLKEIERRLGSVPDVFWAIAHSPSSLDEAWNTFKRLDNLRLSDLVRDEVVRTTYKMFNRPVAVSWEKGPNSDARSVRSHENERVLEKVRLLSEGLVLGLNPQALRTKGLILKTLNGTEAVEIILVVHYCLYMMSIASIFEINEPLDVNDGD